MKSVIEIAGFSWMTIGVCDDLGRINNDYVQARESTSSFAAFAYHLINEHVNPIARIQKGD